MIRELVAETYPSHVRSVCSMQAVLFGLVAVHDRDGTRIDLPLQIRDLALALDHL